MKKIHVQPSILRSNRLKALKDKKAPIVINDNGKLSSAMSVKILDSLGNVAAEVVYKRDANSRTEPEVFIITHNQIELIK
jgi:hypothetical protein